MTKHTPLPFAEGYKQKIIQIVDGHQFPAKMLIALNRGNFTGPGNAPFAYVTNREDAAFIVLACNSFYPMLDALKQAVLIASDENGEVFNGNLREREVYIRNWKQNAIAALSKATPNTDETKGAL